MPIARRCILLAIGLDRITLAAHGAELDATPRRKEYRVQAALSCRAPAPGPQLLIQGSAAAVAMVYGPD